MGGLTRLDMEKILLISFITIFLSAPIFAQDSRYYQLVNRLNRVESEILDLKRIKSRVTQFESITARQREEIREESVRIDELVERNRFLEALLKKLCDQPPDQHHTEACRGVVSSHQGGEKTVPEVQGNRP